MAEEVRGVIKLWVVKVYFLNMALAATIVWSLADEDSSSRRLENAQKGIAEASWPRKPDNRLSPLSGKMKDMKEISPRFFGDEKEVRAGSAAGWQKEAATGQRSAWEGASGRDWENMEWDRGRDWAGSENQNEKFQPVRELGLERAATLRESKRSAVANWSSRSSRIGADQQSSLRMYEGKLKRVREQVWREDESPRELGPGRQEKFSPDEVEKMLSQPAGSGVRRVFTEQSPRASPLATAGN